MSIYTPDQTTLRNLAAEIETLAPRPHHSALIEAANRIRPGCTFRHALSRGGWYRPGGVIAVDGARVAGSIEQWAKAELEKCGSDMHEFVERHADSGLLVTRHSGCTHYLIAPYGPAPADFLQLEIEELHEVLDRELIDVDALPEDLQELLEPLAPKPLEAQAVGAPRYCFRRLLDMRQALARVSLGAGRDAGLLRLLSEWSHSSSASHGHFCDHWLLGLREHLDRYRNPVVSASLISRKARTLKPFHWNDTLSGPAMLAQLQAFDRAAAYPAAWYFHLVAGACTPPKVAYAIAKDLESGYSYLPDTEAALIKSWVTAPYSV